MKKIKIALLTVAVLSIIMFFTLLKDEDGNFGCILVAWICCWLATPKGIKLVEEELKKED